MKARDIVLAGLFAALTAVAAWVRIPLPGGVPLTLQVLVVLLAGAVLGARLGAVSQIVYILLGAIGLPVFAGGGSGPGYLVGPTGGFLIGFVAAAFLVGLVADTQSRADSRAGRGERPFSPALLAAMLGAIAVIYLLGWMQLKVVAKLSWTAAFTAGVLPFIGFDLVKAIIAGVVAPRLRRALRAAGPTSSEQPAQPAA